MSSFAVRAEIWRADTSRSTCTRHPQARSFYSSRESQEIAPPDTLVPVLPDQKDYLGCRVGCEAMNNQDKLREVSRDRVKAGEERLRRLRDVIERRSRLGFDTSEGWRLYRLTAT